MYWIKVGVLLGLAAAVIFTLRAQVPNLHLLLSSIPLKLNTPFSLINLTLLGAVLLVPINWGLEAAKWHTVQSAENSFLTNFKTVIAGLSAGLMVPRFIADYVVRLKLAKVASSSHVVHELAINKIIQAGVTNVFGVLGFLGIWLAVEPDFSWVLSVMSLVTVGVILLLFINLNSVLGWLGRLSFILRIFPELPQVSAAPKPILYRVVGWAALRFIVFSLQFALILYWFGAEIPATTMLSAIAITFFIKSNLPALNFLSDLGVREFSAMLAFSLLSVDESLVIVASLALWFINLLVPALIGSLALSSAVLTAKAN